MIHVLVQENNLIRLARRLVIGNLTIMTNLVGGLMLCLWSGPLPFSCWISCLLQSLSVGLAVEYTSCFISVLNLDFSPVNQ